MNKIIALVILYSGTVFVSCLAATTKQNQTNLFVPESIHGDLRRECEILYFENDRQKKKIEQLRHENQKLIFIQRQYEDLQRTCEESNIERGELRTALANTENYLYQLEWKVIVEQAVDYYEREFNNLEIRQVKSTFQLNQTFLEGLEYDDSYDRLAELRRQRWLFYLENPPSAFWYFNDLVSRLEKSNHTKEQFARGLAILYKRLSHVIYKEALESDKSISRPLSSYDDVNFVIPLLVAQYAKTKPIQTMLEELKKPREHRIGKINPINNLASRCCTVLVSAEKTNASDPNLDSNLPHNRNLTNDKN